MDGCRTEHPKLEGDGDALLLKGNRLASTSLINQEMTRNRAGLHGLVDSVQLEYILTKI